MSGIKPGSGFFSVFSGFRVRLSRTFPQRSPQAAPSGHAEGPYRSNPSCGAGPRTAAAGSEPTAAVPTQERTGGTAEGNRHVFHRKTRQSYPQPPPPFIPDSLNIRGPLKSCGGWYPPNQGLSVHCQSL